MRISILFILIFFPAWAFTQSFEVINLRCENWENPLGIDVSNPSFSWQFRAYDDGFLQSAYQVIVSDNKKELNNKTGNYWNSGKITSGNSTFIKYAGKKLKAAETYYWQVRTWDKNAKPSAWSAVATFTTGLYTAQDWLGAKWIGYEELPDTSIVTPGAHLTHVKQLGEKLKQRAIVPYFRKEFSATKKIVKALAFISGLGQYELSVNGAPVTENFLTPGWTYYDKRVFYNVYDITGKLNSGNNAIGVMVGNGFYNINRERYFKLVVAFGLPKLVCKIQLTYTDGTTGVIISDETWKTTPSPITYSSIFGGEDYDAQLEQTNWDKPGFNDAQWKSALLVKAPKGIIESEKTYPVTVNDRFTVKTITQASPGIYVYDFGQNASGIVELKVKGKKGQVIKLSPAELVNDKQLANQNATGRPYYFSYTLKGNETETWRPRFTYYGFRYVQVEGAVPDTAGNPNGVPVIQTLTSLHTGSASPEAGTFDCSNELFNRIHELIRWAIKSNLQSVVTDCPHREKLSWLEQDHLMGGSIKSNFEVYHLYKKLVYDMMDAQTPEGLVPDIAPEFVFFDDNGFGFRDSPEWGSASVIVPWLLYKWYGDKEIIRTAFPMMKKYVAYLQSRSKEHIISYGLGDWYDYGPNRPGVAQLTPKDLTATAIYYYDVQLLSKMATLLNDQQEAARLKSQAAVIKSAFNNKFYNPATQIYSTGSQTAMAMPLCVGLVDEQNRKAVLKNLVDSITLTGKKLTAGDVGYHYLVQALQEGGESQLLFDMNYRDDVPGYGFQLKKGATALTESWPALKEVSNNHLMLGHLMEWFYNGLAGIDQAENSVGYKHIIIKPEIVGDINFVKATYETPYGPIKSAWEKDGDYFTLKVHIPGNTSATIYLPATATAKGIRDSIQVGSGYHEFTIRLSGLPVERPANVSTGQSSSQSIAQLSTLFQHPPASAKPWVFWYWMHAAASKQGITADLEAMKEAGIGGAYLMPIQDVTNPPLYTPVTKQLSPEWWQLVKFAMEEAKRLGLQIAMHASDGFALAGGPWITPELSMQKIVWSKTYTSGNKQFNELLPQPDSNDNYYRDIAVFAFPSPPGSNKSASTVIPKITTSQPGVKADFLIQQNSRESFRCDTPCWIQYEFPQPFTARSVTIHTNGNNFQSQRLTVYSSDDGELFLKLRDPEPPRHGWQDTDADYTYALPTATARYFRFEYDKRGTEPGAEDLDAAKWRQSLKISGILLTGEPFIHQYEAKSGAVWRLSHRTNTLDDSVCVPLSKIINITDKLSADGKLNWNVPAGDWTIVRIGHMSTGHTNATGGAGKGLECDKFNPEAVRLQFDKWFGEAERQAGPALAKEVLKIFHVDSWECGSQNWSPLFRGEFKKRRGYDILPYLVAMTGIPIESATTSEQFLYDVRLTIADLVKDNFYNTLAKLVHAKGIQFSAESVAPTMMSDGMLHYSAVDLPMGEFWWRSPTHDKPNDMLDAISGAHVYGKNIIQAEAFTTLRMAWDEHPGMLKAMGDRNYALGINRLVYHVFTHNPWMDRKPGMTLDGIGLYFQRDQTWWKMAKAWVGYAQRCQALLQWGKPVVDVAVFTGEELPRRAVLPDRFIKSIPGIVGKEVIESEKKRLANSGEPLRQIPDGVTHSANMADPEKWIDPLHGYAYDSFNPDALLRLATVKNGRIELPGGASYSLLILPGTHQMSPDNYLLSPAIAKRLEELLHDGATIMTHRDWSMGKIKPLHSPGLSKVTAAGADTSFAKWMSNDVTKPSPNNNRLKAGKGMVVRAPFTETSFSTLGIEKDLEAVNFFSREPIAGIAWTHRREGDADIYFISEQLNKWQAFELVLRVTGKLPELWDPVTGEQRVARSRQVKNNRTRLIVTLPANGSLFIVFRKKATPPARFAGANELEVKAIDTLQGNWTVQFDSNYGGPANPVQFQTLKDWTSDSSDSIRYYSGIASYTKPFNWSTPAGKKQRVWLDVGDVNDLATVYVNGVECGIAWTEPYRVEITNALKQGANKLRIDVANTWANRLIGDSLLPEEKRITKTTAPFRLKDKPLLRAGLLGPVVIMTE